MFNFLFVVILVSLSSSSEASFPKKVFSPDQKALLAQLVNINSGTDNIEGNEAVRRKLIPIFTSLGFSAKSVNVGGGRKVLVFDFPGSRPEFLIIGHTDTVFPKDSAFNRFVDEGNILRGPGISDMKAGIILAARLMAELPNPEMRKRFRLAFNDDEETGSLASMKALQQAAQGVNAVLIFEAEDPGFVTTSHSGLVWFDINVAGLASHAGSAHEKGINACVELGYKMVELAKLTDYSRGLTINPGVIAGGTKPNVVCENASLKSDMRYIEFSDRDAAMAKIQKINDTSFVFNAALNQGTTSKLSIVDEAPSMPPGLSSELFRKYQRASAALSIPIQGKHKGAVDSYGLITPGTNLKMLSGLGAAGGGLHSDRETLDLDATEKKFQVTLEFLSDLAKQHHSSLESYTSTMNNVHALR